MKYKLEDICIKITDGSHYSPIDDPTSSIPMLSVKDMEEFDFNYNNCKHISEEEYNKMLKNDCVPKLYDVLVAKDGSYLKEIFVNAKENKKAILSSIAIFRPNQDIVDPYFLCYLLKTPMILNYVKDNCVSGSALPRIILRAFKGIELMIPEIKIQRRIVKIIKNINDKIKINNEINNNLHELLKNQYYKMFVEGKKESWIDDKLGNYLSVDRGLSYKGQFLSETGVPMINLGNVMPNGVFRIEKNKYYSGDYKDKVTIKVGDIVIANTDMTQNREVIGTPIIVPPIYGDKIIFSHHIYGLRNLKLPKMYIFYTLLTDEWNAIAGGSATGTTVLALPKETIENYVVAIPDNKSLQLFDNIAETIQSKRNQILLENIKLEQLRDTLLPKLMNGEIDLDNIEI